jgi:hypothetical protein
MSQYKDPNNFAVALCVADNGEATVATCRISEIKDIHTAQILWEGKTRRGKEYDKWLGEAHARVKEFNEHAEARKAGATVEVKQVEGVKTTVITHPKPETELPSTAITEERLRKSERLICDNVKRYRVSGKKNLTYGQAYDLIIEEGTHSRDAEGKRIMKAGYVDRLVVLNRHHTRTIGLAG